MMPSDRPLVCVVDDEPSVLHGLERLLLSAGYAVRTFVSGRDFLEFVTRDEPACLILDVVMPSMSGLELQAELARAGRRYPTIFVTAYDMGNRKAVAMQAGAVAYFHKPVDSQVLLDAVERAIRGQGAPPAGTDPAGTEQPKGRHP